MQKNKFLFLFFLIVSFTQAQVIVPSQKLNGKVSADSNDLEGIYIINLKTEKSTLTERGGYFSIYANIGDTLVFSAVQFKAIKIALKEKDISNELFFVKMESLIRVLDEVRIDEYKNINAISLGIISPNTKHFTPAERKLYTATSGGGILPIDPILNAISGRTAMLKKEVEIEKKETLKDKVERWYEEKYFTQTLKIPQDYVKGFLFYVVEDAKFAQAVNAKNKTMATFLINELAVNYLDLIKEKK